MIAEAILVVRGGEDEGNSIALSSGMTMIGRAVLTPNPPKDTDGRREESRRGVRELQGK